jgi:hypothetical protein
MSKNGMKFSLDCPFKGGLSSAMDLAESGPNWKVSFKERRDEIYRWFNPILSHARGPGSFSATSYDTWESQI